jgi:hypothetical protein
MRRAEELLRQMTIEEKAMQLSSVPPLAPALSLDEEMIDTLPRRVKAIHSQRVVLLF